MASGLPLSAHALPRDRPWLGLRHALWDAVGADGAPTVAFILAVLAALGVLAQLGTHHTFSSEEGDLLSRNLIWADILRPHNEHPSMMPVVAYALLVKTVGTGSYLPYLGLLWALHVAAAAAIFAIIRGWPGVGAAAVFLFLGSGAENLFWALQIGFVGSVTAGLWAMRTERPERSALLVAIAIACSGIGLVFLMPVAILRRRGALWLAFPVALYAGWWLLFRTPLEYPGDPSATIAWAVRGIGWAFSGLFGVGLPVGIGLFVGLLALARRGDRLTLASLAGLVTLYIVIGVARAGAAFPYEAASRYVYVAAPFILIALAGTRRDRPLLGAAYALAFGINVLALAAS